MKKLFIVSLLMIVQFSFGQLYFNLAKNIYYPCVIELEDGTEKTGFVLDFRDKSFITMAPSEERIFKSREDFNDLTLKNYFFRPNENAKDEKIPIESIKRISLEKNNFISGEPQQMVYEKVMIAKPKNNLEFKYIKDPIMLPVSFSNAKMTVYSFNEVLCVSDVKSCRNLSYNYYFKVRDSDYAVKPVDLSGASLFAMGKIGPKIHSSFQFFGKDCPAYLQGLNQRKESFNNKVSLSKDNPFNKGVKQGKELFKQKSKEAKATMPKDEFKEYLVELKIQQLNNESDLFYQHLFEEEVIEYINSCE